MSILLFTSSREFISIMHWIVSNPTWFFINVYSCFIINILLGTFLWLIVDVQLLSCVRLFVTPWPAACQASLSFTMSFTMSEFAQTRVQWVSVAIQPSHPLLPTSPLALNLSQHQGLYQWVGSSHQVAKVLELQLQHQNFQWIFRVNFLWG